jgi:2-hydroxy-6-oxonona-2,4-dienedioate hydrolase
VWRGTDLNAPPLFAEWIEPHQHGSSGFSQISSHQRLAMSGTLQVLTVALIAVVAAGGLVFLSYSDEIDRASAVASSGGRIANTTAGLIEYAENGAGMPLLSIHGAGGGYDQGLANSAGLVGDGFRVIAPSRFGYLGTPIPADASPSAQADAHAALLAELKVDRAIVVGISAGARSALELSLRHPDQVAALILIVPGTYAPASPVAIEGSRGSQFAFWLVNAGADFAWWVTEKIAPSVLIRFIGVPPEVVAAAPKAEQDRVRQIVRSVQPLSRRFPGINIDSNPDLGRLPLSRIDMPTLVISARDDLFNTLPAAELAARSIPNAKLVVYDTGGHLLVGHDREVRSTIGGFLAQAGVNPTPPSVLPGAAASKPQ